MKAATDSRSGWVRRRISVRRGALTAALQEELPGHLRHWWFALGGTAAFLFFVQVVTGILLALYYRPDPAVAYESVRYITEEVAFGWFIRSLHKWAATFMVAAVALHHMRTYFTGAYRYPRELSWMLGTLLLACTLLTAFTGYSLVFEQLSYWGATVGASLAARVPFIGPVARQFLYGGEFYNDTTLSRFFIMHGAILPAALTVLMILHVLLVRLQGVSELEDGGAERDAAKSAATPYRLLPDHLYTELTVALVLLITLSALATALPASLGPPADPLTTPESIKPEWFFYPMFRWLKLFSATVAMLTMGLALFVSLLWPFVERMIMRYVKVPDISIWIGLVVVAALLGLTVWEAAAGH